MSQAIKVVLLGESAVGKSSIALRMVKDSFDDHRESTIGAAFLSMQMNRTKDGKSVSLNLWDTAGQERYKSLAPMYCRNAQAAIVVYDITSKDSLNQAKSWIKELNRQADPGILILLIANKMDLAAEQREISDEQGKRLAQEESATLMECSAKTGNGVTEIFQTIADRVELPSSATTVPGTKSRVGGIGTGGVELGRSGQSASTEACSC